MSRMTTVVSGYMKFGRVHEWEQSKDGDTIDRKMFRGQLSYRDATMLEKTWYDVDVVCFKDNPYSEKNGLVGMLENYFLAEDGPRTSKDGETAIGGQAIELVGYFRPTKRKRPENVTLNLKNNKKKVIEIEVEYPTFEFVITDAGFPPNTEGSMGNSSSNEVLDFDDIDEDDIEGVADDAEEEEVEEKVETKKNTKKAKKTKKASSSKTQKKDTQDSEEDSSDEDEDFFDD